MIAFCRATHISALRRVGQNFVRLGSSTPNAPQTFGRSALHANGPYGILLNCPGHWEGIRGRDTPKQVFLSLDAGVAQLVEHLICNQRVGGSSPFASSSIWQGRLGCGTGRARRVRQLIQGHSIGNVFPKVVYGRG